MTNRGVHDIHASVRPSSVMSNRGTCAPLSVSHCGGMVDVVECAETFGDDLDHVDVPKTFFVGIFFFEGA